MGRRSRKRSASAPAASPQGPAIAPRRRRGDPAARRRTDGRDRRGPATPRAPAPPRAPPAPRHRRPAAPACEDAPKAPWSPFPLVELTILFGIVLIVLGLRRGGRPPGAVPRLRLRARRRSPASSSPCASTSPATARTRRLLAGATAVVVDVPLFFLTTPAAGGPARSSGVAVFGVRVLRAAVGLPPSDRGHRVPGVTDTSGEPPAHAHHGPAPRDARSPATSTPPRPSTATCSASRWSSRPPTTTTPTPATSGSATPTAGAGTLLSFLEYPAMPEGSVGVGSTHHLALAVDSAEELDAWRDYLRGRGVQTHRRLRARPLPLAVPARPRRAHPRARHARLTGRRARRGRTPPRLRPPRATARGGRHAPAAVGPSPSCVGHHPALALGQRADRLRLRQRAWREEPAAAGPAPAPLAHQQVGDRHALRLPGRLEHDVGRRAARPSATRRLSSARARRTSLARCSARRCCGVSRRSSLTRSCFPPCRPGTPCRTGSSCTWSRATARARARLARRAGLDLRKTPPASRPSTACAQTLLPRAPLRTHAQATTRAATVSTAGNRNMRSERTFLCHPSTSGVEISRAAVG